MKKNRVTKVERQGKTIELENPVTISGSLMNCPNAQAQHVLFLPDDAESMDNPKLRYRCSGKLNSYTDGTIEFVRTVRPKTQAKELVKTERGRVSLTLDNFYLLTLRVPADGKHDVSKIIRNEAAEIADAMEGME